VVVFADPTLVTEAISNLLSNAVSFANEESTIDLVMTTGARTVLIEVTNKGPLIEGDAERLFNPFASTRADPSSEHQGLGLYIVRLVIEHHEGTVSLANLEDESGVRASVTLPLRTAGAPAPDAFSAYRRMT
jgi:signal transduction histidine kinase